MHNLNTIKFFYIFIFTISVTLSCKPKKQDDPAPVVVVVPIGNPTPPAVIYSGNKQNMLDADLRLAMFESLIEYTQTGNTKGVFVDSVKLKNMFYNISNPFDTAYLNVSGLNIADAVDPAYKTEIEKLFGKLSVASKSQVESSDGFAGVKQASTTSSFKLYDTKGIAIYELIEKQLMGSLQLYQICSVLLAENNLKNQTKEIRLQTWDKAFAYLGLTPDFLNYKITKPGLPFWGEYFGLNDDRLGTNVSKIMNSFISGRSSIEANNEARVLENAQTIRIELSRTAAGMALTYLRRTRLNIINSDLTRRNSAFSEGIGFLKGLRSHPEKKINSAILDGIILDLGTSSWEMSDTTKIVKAYNSLANSYYLDAKNFN